MSSPPRAPASLVLGTVQFGLDYGVSNTGGQVSDAAAHEILELAESAGVVRLDTAAAYGRSETVLARLLQESSRLRVITKAPRLGPDSTATVIRKARESAALFGPERLDAILLHAAADLAGSEGEALWAALKQLKMEGLVRRIGFSAYADDRPLDLARRFSPDIVQIAASVFDQRLVADGQIRGIGELGVEVHVRSIFLQGLAFMTPGNLPPGLSAASGLLDRWGQDLERAQTTPAQACLDFALGLEGAARIVIGVTSPTELAEILALVSAPSPALDYARFAHDDPGILDPWRW
ncbi:MAG: bifunctional regulator KidO [Brevundimonas sp.]|nr:MAG: bifunctional regulator KidO [Brevundimonas sp.]